VVISNEGMKVIEINWIKEPIDYNPSKRWVDLWGEE